MSVVTPPQILYEDIFFSLPIHSKSKVLLIDYHTKLCEIGVSSFVLRDLKNFCWYWIQITRYLWRHRLSSSLVKQSNREWVFQTGSIATCTTNSYQLFTLYLIEETLRRHGAGMITSFPQPKGMLDLLTCPIEHISQITNEINNEMIKMSYYALNEIIPMVHTELIVIDHFKPSIQYHYSFLRAMNCWLTAAWCYKETILAGNSYLFGCSYLLRGHAHKRGHEQDEFAEEMVRSCEIRVFLLKANTLYEGKTGQVLPSSSSSSVSCSYRFISQMLQDIREQLGWDNEKKDPFSQKIEALMEDRPDSLATPPINLQEVAPISPSISVLSELFKYGGRKEFVDELKLQLGFPSSPPPLSSR